MGTTSTAAAAGKPARVHAARPRHAGKASDQRRADLAAIHAAAKKLGMDTTDKSPASVYRTVVFTAGKEGKHSAAELSPAGRRRVVAYLQRQLNPGSVPHSDGPMAGMIDRLWRQLGQMGALDDPTPQGLNKFLRSTQGVDSLRFLTGMQGSKVVEALKAWKARAGKV
jgi:phage gp16-like protein